MAFWGEDDLNPMADQQDFATAENVENCTKYLLNSLSGLGMSDQLRLGSSKPQDMADVCNCLYALIQQRQADKDTQEKLEGLVTKMRLDVQASSSERSRLEVQLQEKFTELGSLEIKVRAMQQKHRADMEASGKQTDALNLRCKQAERREQQLETKLRQQVAETEGLKAKLRAALQAKSNRAGGPQGATLDEGDGLAAFTETAPPSIGAPPPHGQQQQRSRPRPGSASSSSKAAATGAAGGRNVRSVSAAGTSSESVPGADVSHLQKMLQATEARASSLNNDNMKLREQLHDMRTEFEQLLARCESLGVGTAPAEQSSLSMAKLTHNNPRCLNSNSQRRQHKQQHHSRHTAAAEAMSSEDLRAYLGTELKAVQNRCRGLLDGLAAKKAARSTPPASPGLNPRPQHQGGPGASTAAGGAVGAGAEDTWGSAVAGAEMQEQLDDAQVVLQEQEKGLARALVALHRAEAQRTAAQQRASAAQLRSVQLEKRLTQATKEQLASGERLMEMRATVYDLEAQVSKLQQVLAMQGKELQHALAMQQQGSSTDDQSRENGGAMLAHLRQDLLAAELEASAAQAAARQQAAHIEAQDMELALVRRQLALMTQAVVMTGSRHDGAAAADRPDAGGEGDQPQPHHSHHKQHTPMHRPSNTAAVRDLSALLHDDDEHDGEEEGDFQDTAADDDEHDDDGDGAPVAVNSSPMHGVASTPAAVGCDPGEYGSGFQRVSAGGGSGDVRAQDGPCTHSGPAPTRRPFQLALQGLSDSSRVTASVEGPAGGGGSSRRHRQRWDMSPCAPAATPSPRQLLQEAESPSSNPPPSYKTAPASGNKLSSSNGNSQGAAGAGEGGESVSMSTNQRGLEISDSRGMANHEGMGAAATAHMNSNTSTKHGDMEATIGTCMGSNTNTKHVNVSTLEGGCGGSASSMGHGREDVDSVRSYSAEAGKGTGDGDGGSAAAESTLASSGSGSLTSRKSRFRKLSTSSNMGSLSALTSQHAAPDASHEHQQQADDMLHPNGALLYGSSSPHTPQASSPSTSAASQATLGSYVTAVGGDTPSMPTPASAALPTATHNEKQDRQKGTHIDSGSAAASQTARVKRPATFWFDM